jgi:hypothetical protein
MKCKSLALKSIFGPTPRCSPLQTNRRINIEDKRQIRLSLSDDQSVKGLNCLTPCPARLTLIGAGGIRKSVTQDYRTAFQGWTDQALQMVFTRGKE